MKCCVICNWPMDDEHVFNVNCAVANAENDQIMAEVDEARAQAWTATDEALVQRGMEIVHDILALKNFERNLHQP